VTPIVVPYCGTIEFEKQDTGYTFAYNNCCPMQNGQRVVYATEYEAVVAGITWAKKLILEGLAELDRQYSPRSAPSYPPATPKEQRAK
jgi:hypothetical protein